ncbi:siderophore-mediated iron transport protein [Bdellovibrio bacteriovorus W]|nr:siderophore-mediated iron transport protein [Bdellovibrio bacteriovorus W]
MVNQAQLNLKISSSFVISAVLHGAAFVLALALAAPQKSPLPVGVELMYGEATTVSAPSKPQSLNIQKTQAAPVAAMDDDGVAIEQKKKEKPVPAPVTPQVAEQKTLGNPLGTSTTGALTGREGVANGSEVSPEERYLYELRKLLERRKKYPVMARRMGHTGKVMMRFTLSSDGSLAASEVVEKTPYDSLNNAAVELVKGIDGIKPFPKEITRNAWVITVPIEYSLN